MVAINPGLFINGSWILAETLPNFPSRNPVNEKVLGLVPETSSQQLEDAVQAAHKALGVWGQLPGLERAQYLLKVAKQFEDHQTEVVEVLIAETGSSFSKAMFELDYTVRFLKAASADFRFGNGEVFPSDDGTLSYTTRRPLGVIACISPWNVPLVLTIKKVANALIAGNTVVLKPSEDSSLTVMKLVEMFAAAELPAGVLNLITGHGDVGRALIAHPLTKAVSFTGSTATGKKIAAQAGGLLKRCVLELGGKDALIILEDVDLDFAVNVTAFSGLFHQGQICMSAERILVQSSIIEQFTEKLLKKVQGLKIGDPSDHSVDLGPMMSQNQVDIVKDHVEDAKRLGANVLCGGEHSNGLFYPPTVLTGVTRDMKLFKDETFGPLLPIMGFETIDEAIDIANDSEYGLSGGVLTNDVEKAFYITNRLDTGMVHIGNGPLVDDPIDAMFGGVKGSGMGRENGKASYEAFTELKWVTVHHKKPGFPF
ncbi:NAD-dependent aldehyde dehydrogenase [Umbelopsis sp. AD052]|nr:NAD-dependent aldehyde dehydrogenase [Umbelopsis sp. AD052]